MNCPVAHERSKVDFNVLKPSSSQHREYSFFYTEKHFNQAVITSQLLEGVFSYDRQANIFYLAAIFTSAF